MREPLHLCAVIEAAMQVHARDGWVLTLADMLGGQGRKYCHLGPAATNTPACRRKYRKRVVILQPRFEAF